MNLCATSLGLRVGDRSLCSGLSFCAEAGQLWCVLGRNGAGKSTLLRTLAGLSEPAAGRVEIDGRPLTDLSLRALARARAFLPQRLADRMPLTVREAVALGRFPHGDALPVAAGVVEEALVTFDLSAWAGRDVRTLSGGERQRVALATLWVQDAPLWLLDEPFAHLDLDAALAMLELLQQRNREHGTVILMSLHDLNLAARAASHVLLFSGGSCNAGPASEFLTVSALEKAFGLALYGHEADGRRWFIPA